MVDVIPFRQPSLKERHKGKVLCKHGHHKWVVDTAKQFDVKQGKLITSYRCVRCDKRKVKAH